MEQYSNAVAVSQADGKLIKIVVSSEKNTKDIIIRYLENKDYMKDNTFKEYSLPDAQDPNEFLVHPECGEGMFLLYLTKHDNYYLVKIASSPGWIYGVNFVMNIIESFKNTPY